MFPPPFSKYFNPATEMVQNLFPQGQLTSCAHCRNSFTKSLLHVFAICAHASFCRRYSQNYSTSSPSDQIIV